MAPGVVVVIASEFMPVSLLTPVARDLAISQEQAGQAISMSIFFAVLTSLLNTPLTGRFDRKKVLIAFTFLLTLSSLTVTFAPDGLTFMGQFGIFTYLRPFMESVTGASVSELSFMLLLPALFAVLASRQPVNHDTGR